jgi:hypothetical protein
MKSILPLLVSAFVALSSLGCAGAPKTAAPQSAMVPEVTSVPDGHYLLNLQVGQTVHQLNFRVERQLAVCVNADAPKVHNLQGRFEPIGNGVFLVSLHNNQYHGSQYWIFKRDGSAVVKEIPDRGEIQRAIPVAAATLDRPRGS